MPPKMEPQEVTDLKRSISAHKGHLQRAINAGEDYSSCLETRASALLADQLKEEMTKMKEQMTKIVEKYDQLATIDPDNAAEYGAAQDDIHTRTTRTIRAGLVILHTAFPPEITPPAAVTPAGPKTKWKPNSELKPEKLLRDSTPTEFHHFIARLEDYFDSDDVVTAPPRKQRGFLLACIDKHLQAVLEEKVQADPNISVFGAGGCIEKLREYYCTKHPLFNRQLAFFEHTQAHGQKWTEAALQLRQKADLADLGRITIDDLMVFKYVGMTTDKKLREKLTSCGTGESPTIAELLKTAEQYEADISIGKAADKSGNQGKKLTERSLGQGKTGRPRGTQKKTKSTGGMTQQRLLDEKRCFRCGSQQHTSPECPKKDSLKCNKCKKDGHSAFVCTGGQIAWKKKGGDGSRSQPSSRPPSRAPSRATSPTGRDEDLQKAASVMVRSVKGKSEAPPLLHLQLRRGMKSFTFPAYPDTGSTRTIVALDVLRRHRVSLSSDRSEELVTANGGSMACEGSVELQATYDGGPSANINALVSSDLKDEILLGWPDLKKLEVVPRGFPCRAATVDVLNFDNVMDSLKTQFKDVLDNELGTKKMKGPPMKIHFRSDIKFVPTKALTCSKIPLHLEDAVQEEMKRLLVDTLAPVPPGVPTASICRGKFIGKYDDDGNLRGVRLVTDFSPLNAFIDRPVHPFPTSQEIVQDIHPTSRFFAKLDAVQGYHQIPLDEDSSYMTTFLLPFGRFRYLRAPMGLCASSDEWCHRSDLALAGLPGVKKLVDDILVQAPTKSILFERIKTVLQRCREHGITISREKMLAGESVKFAGHIISSTGVYPDPDKTRAIADFPPPKDVTGLRSFLGLANQLGHFIPDLSHMSTEMRKLLKKDTAFIWLDEHQAEFDAIRSVLTSDLVVKPFKRHLRTELLTDASRLHGLGFVLIQREDDGQLRLIDCGSCSLTDTQSRYATIELECLAIQWAIKKSSFYLKGHPGFTVVTDHRPLVGIFNKSLTELDNPRLYRLRSELTTYSFEVTWVAGKTHLIADALSRAPVFPPSEERDVDDTHLCFRVATDPKMQLLYDASSSTEYRRLVEALRAGKDPRSLPPQHPARAFTSVWKCLSLQDGDEDPLVIYDGSRIVVPPAARSEILRLLHVPHAGIAKTRQAARQLYYWPGMANDIKLLTEACSACHKLLPSLPAEPLIQKEASGPMTDVSVDLFSHAGHDWVVMADRYSGFPWTKRLTSTSTGAVLKVLTQWFLDFGYPKTIRSDGGPQFRTEFEDYCRTNGITHETSSPYHPESNGHAEAAVKAVKHLLKKCRELDEDFATALFEWRNVPRQDGFSPAAMFFGHRQRGLLPTLPVRPINQDHAISSRKESRRYAKDRFDSRASILPNLAIGDRVLLQDPVSKTWTMKGTVVSTLPSGRTYEIETDDAGKKIRNRRFLRPYSSADEADSTASPPRPILRRSDRLSKGGHCVQFSD